MSSDSQVPSQDNHVVEQGPPPPTWMKANDPTEANDARQAIAKRIGRGPLAWLQSVHVYSKPKDRIKRDLLVGGGPEGPSQPAGLAQSRSSTIGEVQINSPVVSEDPSKDQYRWAILYENQRGVTLFSSSYYSRLSLLPTDPPAFTLPYAGPSTSTSVREARRHQPKITKLSEYPLPDGTWEWVSQCWMIDMREDGEVQHDGFEYNWLFRRHYWRAEVGKFNAGGWVRRRRWVRLMVRRVESVTGKMIGDIEDVENSGPSSVRPSPDPSVVGLPFDKESTGERIDTGIWKGDQEMDWQRCHAMLKRLPRDRRKLELWAVWLGLPHHMSPVSSLLSVSDSASTQQQLWRKWTEDEEPLPSEVAFVNRVFTTAAHVHLEYIAPVVRVKFGQLFGMFIYPDSRLRFMQQLDQAGVLPDLDSVHEYRKGSIEDRLIAREFRSYVTEQKKTNHSESNTSLSTSPQDNGDQPKDFGSCA
ncbi:hypothetical protein NEOLEDRAFT_1126163 [Neolentinus lepideus HHB14362 ss-1]|uniref:TECPR1-like DysF domain-containing protein n=1 Tax=Neolentinus lepideus HHB14362 ss-1 TaxID=1314782 RepID=A0A165W2I0_9AGAM|nr:hypothetical protein NEOLEDRAFT_1126163 [Neolentinus lepideus HHB14362 ss-1]